MGSGPSDGMPIGYRTRFFFRAFIVTKVGKAKLETE